MELKIFHYRSALSVRLHSIECPDAQLIRIQRISSNLIESFALEKRADYRYFSENGDFDMASVTLSASEFQDRVGEALDRSLSQPVLITKHGRPRNVVLSYDEYERLRARDRRAVRAEDLTEEDIAALEGSAMAPGYEHLDAEIEEK